MKKAEYEMLTDRLEKADMILSERYELSLRVGICKRIIKGQKCIYVSLKDSRRFPTSEEINQARLDLASYSDKIKVLDCQFAEL